MMREGRDSTLAGIRAAQDASGPWGHGILRSGGPRARWVVRHTVSCEADRAGRYRDASAARWVRIGGRCRDHGARRSAAGLYPTCTDCRKGSAAAARTDPWRNLDQRHRDGRMHPRAVCSSRLVSYLLASSRLASSRLVSSRLASAGHHMESWIGYRASTVAQWMFFRREDREEPKGVVRGTIQAFRIAASLASTRRVLLAKGQRCPGGRTVSSVRASAVV